jgi:hypothetical protein
MTTLINLYDINPPPMVEFKDYGGGMQPKYVDGREVLCYPNAKFCKETYKNKTYEQFKQEVEPFEKLRKETYELGVYKLDKDIKVGHVISMKSGYRYEDLYEVSRITKCFIVFKECEVVKTEIKDTSGDTITYSKYIDKNTNGVEKKKKIIYYENPNIYDGYKVFDKRNTIMIKSGVTDFWR